MTSCSTFDNNYDHHVPMEEGLRSMIGRTFVSIQGSEGDGELLFTADNGDKFLFSHYQECCEEVLIEDIVGDLNDLIGEPILMAEESFNHQEETHELVSITWTFYKFATRKGFVDIRWVGSSNGYYSESVDLYVMRNE